MLKLFGWTHETSTNPLTVEASNYVHEVVLVYGALTVTLPAPRLGDGQTLNPIRINRQTKGLKRDQYRDSTWYSVMQYDWYFPDLTLALKDDFIELVETAAGDVIEVTDYMDRTRNMFVTDIYEVEEVRNDQCSYLVGGIFQEIF